MVKTHRPILYAQGDILIEKVADIAAAPDTRIPDAPDGAVVLASGERTGHRHVIHGGAVMHQLGHHATDVPDNLYLGHLVVTASSAIASHDEHSDIELPRGTYRVRRQREHTSPESRRSRLVAD